MMKRGPLIFLFLLLLEAQALAFNFATGMYSGNGADNRDITVSPSFVINAVMVKCSGQHTVMSLSSMPAGQSDSLTSGGGISGNKIQSMGTGTFQVGTDATVNVSGTDNCFYVAWGLDANNDLSVEVDDADDGSYVGDGLDNRDIVIKPAFQPEGMFLLAEIDNANRWRVAAETTGSLPFGTASETANCIQAFNPDGFEVGTSAQCNDGSGGTVDFWPFSVKAISGYVASGSYVANTGSCADNCSVNIGFQPDFLIIKGTTSTTTSVFRTAAMAGDLSCRTSSFSCVANFIQSFTANGFTYGSDASVNENGTTFYWLAIKTPVYAPGGGGGGLRGAVIIE